MKPINRGAVNFDDLQTLLDPLYAWTVEDPRASREYNGAAGTDGLFNVYVNSATSEGYVDIQPDQVLIGVSNSLATSYQLKITDSLARFSGEIVCVPPSSTDPVSIGEVTIEATSDGQLTFKRRGSNGNVWSGSIALSD